MKDFDWTVTKPLPSKIPDIKLKFRGCKELVILSDNAPIITKKINTNSFNKIIKIYEKEINKELDTSFSKIKQIYGLIGTFLKSHDRLKLSKKFEEGSLKCLTLFGDHIYFEGFKIEGKYIYAIRGS